MLEYRCARQDDFQHILALQAKNLQTSLPIYEQQDGFLSTAYSLEQFHGMHNSLGIAVCWDKGSLCGYLCSSQPDFIRSLPNPFPKAMIQHCETVQYQDKKLSECRFFIGNPACIEKNYRGRGVFSGLCQYIIQKHQIDYELGVTFISTSNLRSLKASQKIGLQKISQFTLEKQSFWILSYDLKGNYNNSSSERR